MLRKTLSICMWIACVVISHAQSIPAEWKCYTSNDYLYDIQRDTNEKGLSESQFKKKLQESAISYLAKKVQIQVSDYAQMNKSSVNGRANINYQSSTEFSTNVNLTLTDYKFKYDSQSKVGEIIVYINKPTACMFYKNELRQALNRIDNAIETSHGYMANGFKEKARKELNSTLRELDNTSEPLFWLNIYGLAQEDFDELLGECNSKQQTVKRLLADLEHGTAIYISCDAELFGNNHPAFEKELKGELAGNINCSFIDNKTEADWVIEINAKTRKYNTANYNGIVSFYSYADAQLSIFKVITSQMIYEDEVSAKGGHSISYDEAGRIAYKELAKKLNNILISNLKE